GRGFRRGGDYRENLVASASPSGRGARLCGGDGAVGGLRRLGAQSATLFGAGDAVRVSNVSRRNTRLTNRRSRPGPPFRFLKVQGHWRRPRRLSWVVRPLELSGSIK